jgi:3D (Asp-Asp-Asp) domain-containing protein
MRRTRLRTVLAWLAAAVVATVIAGRFGRPPLEEMQHEPLLVYAPPPNAVIAPLVVTPPEMAPKIAPILKPPRPIAVTPPKPGRMISGSVGAAKAVAKGLAEGVRSGATGAGRSKDLPRPFSKVKAPTLPRLRSLLARAPVGEPIPVTITQYCLKGTTRRGLPVRPGIVAADPRVFPLARHIELRVNGKYVGRFLVDDTGGAVKGNTIDMWTSDCSAARQFGRRKGTAELVALDG